MLISSCCQLINCKRLCCSFIPCRNARSVCQDRSGWKWTVPLDRGHEVYPGSKVEPTLWPVSMASKWFTNWGGYPPVGFIWEDVVLGSLGPLVYAATMLVILIDRIQHVLCSCLSQVCQEVHWICSLGIVSSHFSNITVWPAAVLGCSLVTPYPLLWSDNQLPYCLMMDVWIQLFMWGGGWEGQTSTSVLISMGHALVHDAVSGDLHSRAFCSDNQFKNLLSDLAT